MAKSYEALMKAEAERTRAAQHPDPVITPPRQRAPAVQPRSTCQHLDPAVEEQYQKLRGLLFANGARENLQVRHGGGIANTATGTTTTCTILASLLARSNAGDVVLVDANLRTPSLHELFALPPTSRGLTDVASQSRAGPRSRPGHADPEPVRHPVRDGRCRARPPCTRSPSPLLIADLRQDFRYVMLDCSPVEQYSDASFVAPRVDGIVMVIRSEVTRIETAIKTKRQLEWAGGKVIGTVLNDKRNYIPLLLQRFL